MSDTMKKEREVLLDYGHALEEIAVEVLPIFDNLVDRCAETAGKLVGAQQGVENLRRNARSAWLKDLIESGATPEDAVSLIRLEMELSEEASADRPAIAGQIALSLLGVVGSLMAQTAVQGDEKVQTVFDALFNRAQSQSPTEESQEPQEE